MAPPPILRVRIACSRAGLQRRRRGLCLGAEVEMDIIECDGRRVHVHSDSQASLRNYVQERPYEREGIRILPDLTGGGCATCFC